MPDSVGGGPSSSVGSAGSEGTGLVVTDRFVVGTGRCGSTLLTRMLAEHRDVVGLNEVFTGLDWGRRFADGVHTGDEVADLLATPNPVTHDALSRGYDAEEITYPFRPTDRYRREDPLPWVLVSTLAYLSDDPDVLFDRTMAWLRRRPSATMAEHYRSLFDWWAGGAGVSVWVERSGSSLDYLADLARLFPAARFVHLHRDGAEVALSMRNHALYRLAVQLTYGVVPDGVDPDDDSPEGRDRLVRAWLDGTPPVELYGTYWSDQVERGCAAASALPWDRLLTLSFEELVRGAEPAMAGLADFLDLPPDPGFPARAARLVRGVPPARAPALPEAERAALEAACARGRRALAGN
jgi:putative sulfotransferase